MLTSITKALELVGDPGQLRIFLFLIPVSISPSHAPVGYVSMFSKKLSDPMLFTSIFWSTFFDDMPCCQLLYM